MPSPKKSQNKLIGRIGETLAVRYLKQKGFQIIETNFHKGYSEIDIVAKEKGTLVFIEVKTRKSGVFGTPLEAITYWKLKAMIRSAQYYKLLHPDLPDSLRIDVISLVLKEDNQIDSIEHIRNITL